MKYKSQPDNMATICTGDFNQNLDNVKFPSTLNTIQFGKKFDQDITCLQNIYSLEKIYVPVGWKKSFKLPYGCVLLYI